MKTDNRKKSQTQEEFLHKIDIKWGKVAQESAIDARIIEGVKPFIAMGVTVFRLARESKIPVEKWGELPPRSLEEICAAPSAGRTQPRDPLENFAIALGARAKTPWGYLHCIDADLRDSSKKPEVDAAVDFALPNRRGVCHGG